MLISAVFCSGVAMHAGGAVWALDWCPEAAGEEFKPQVGREMLLHFSQSHALYTFPKSPLELQLRCKVTGIVQLLRCQLD